MSSFAVESITDDAKEELNKYKVKLCCEIRFLAISCHDFFSNVIHPSFCFKDANDSDTTGKNVDLWDFELFTIKVAG